MKEGNVGDGNKVRIFDTTLRDGEQAPGIALTRAEKVEIAEQLARLNVDILEAGFPVSSEGEFDAVAEIASSVRGPVIAALARTTEGDIRRAAEALKGAEDWRIHTFISTSQIHMEDMLRMSHRQVLGRDPRQREARRQLHRRRRVLGAGRDPDRAGLPARVLPRGGGVRRDHDQRARHGGLRHADGVRRAGARDPRGDARRRRHLHALPQRSGAGGRELAGRDRERRPAGGGRGERHRRAGGELRARGDRHDRPHARAGARCDARPEHEGDHPDVAARLDDDRLQRAAEQVGRGRQRVRARERHPSARCAQQPRHVRDHGPARRRPGGQPPGPGQAQRPARVRRRPGEDRAHRGRGAPGPGVRAVQGPGRPEDPDHRSGPRGDRRRGARFGRGGRSRARVAPGRRRHAPLPERDGPAPARRRGDRGVGVRRRHDRRRVRRDPARGRRRGPPHPVQRVVGDRRVGRVGRRRRPARRRRAARHRPRGIGGRGRGERAGVPGGDQPRVAGGRLRRSRWIPPPRSCRDPHDRGDPRRRHRPGGRARGPEGARGRPRRRGVRRRARRVRPGWRALPADRATRCPTTSSRACGRWTRSSWARSVTPT